MLVTVYVVARLDYAVLVHHIGNCDRVCISTYMCILFCIGNKNMSMYSTVSVFKSCICYNVPFLMMKTTLGQIWSKYRRKRCLLCLGSILILSLQFLKKLGPELEIRPRSPHVGTEISKDWADSKSGGDRPGSTHTETCRLESPKKESTNLNFHLAMVIREFRWPQVFRIVSSG